MVVGDHGIPAAGGERGRHRIGVFDPLAGDIQALSAERGHEQQKVVFVVFDDEQAKAGVERVAGFGHGAARGASVTGRRDMPRAGVSREGGSV